MLAFGCGAWSEAFGNSYYEVALVTISLFFDDHQIKIMIRTKNMDRTRIGIAYSVKLKPNVAVPQVNFGNEKIQKYFMMWESIFLVGHYGSFGHTGKLNVSAEFAPEWFPWHVWTCRKLEVYPH
ncbi:MAG: hypothetical protein QW231_00250 [Candidatus Bathyarchaeia archaeon]